ncbi:ER degradation-enhancing alpha-mannosidase-like protein 1 [Venturia nashicola]|uniref:ER degradation-enhancing alpha-mannosidase-like protein 1 n=1 Tax=Venturia nashicola TaxID=86259 RepID=A0A4Z1PHM4_9PEZI|nr:ER degradation-enhancing alpha-mannosidase-like protein 1 [Venturia nashicola]TLD39110.1 ER degradation-enhancing alpha-mannosidase-like protein 1 [Venturia nashicola]
MDPKVDQAFTALGLPTTATHTAIKAAYRRLALLRQPDKVPAGRKAQAQEDMKVLNAAVETLERSLDWKDAADLAREREREEWANTPHLTKWRLLAGASAWQQQYAEAGIWLAEKKAPVGANAVVEEEEETDACAAPLPSDGKIDFSLCNLKK